MSTIIHGNFVNLEILDNGNLKIFADKVQLKDIALGLDNLSNLLDSSSQIGSGWAVIDGYSISLHGGDMIIHDYRMDDKWGIILDNNSQLWIDPCWEIRDPIDEIFHKGYVIFQRIPSSLVGC